MNVELIIIGDEILLGLIEDRNAVFLCRRLAEIGITVKRIHKIGDSVDAISGILTEASSRCDLIITSGGLGPTHDDQTRYAIARCLNSSLELNPAALEEIENLYRRSGRKMTDANRIQAMIPRGAYYLSNPVGTAPGIHCQIQQANVFSLPGIPRELVTLFEQHLLPWLLERGYAPMRFFRTIRTTQIPESVLYEHTRDLIESYQSYLTVAFLPKITRGVDIRLTLNRDHREEQLLEEPLQRWIEKLNLLFDHPVYALDDGTMEETVAQLFFQTGKTVATAESCTAGMLSDRLTRISGSSRFFLNGVITYSNQSKTDWLNIPESIIRQYGAVSEATAKAMAENIRFRSGADIGISITGIAGPTGGTPEKPVGTVYIGLSAKNHLQAYQPFRILVPLDRLEFKERTTQFALDVLRKFLLSCAE